MYTVRKYKIEVEVAGTELESALFLFFEKEAAEFNGKYGYTFRGTIEREGHPVKCNFGADEGE